MIIPVRCFECGKVLANKYEYFKRRVMEDKIKKNKNPDQPSVIDINSDDIEKTVEGKVLDEMGLKCDYHMCCRMRILTHIDLSLKIN